MWGGPGGGGGGEEPAVGSLTADLETGFVFAPRTSETVCLVNSSRSFPSFRSSTCWAVNAPFLVFSLFWSHLLYGPDLWIYALPLPAFQ